MSLAIIARESVPAWKAVTADGYVADSANVAHLNKVLGVSQTGMAYPSSQTVVALTGDVVNCPIWGWTPGLPIYLNGKTLSHSPPALGFKLIVGLATRVDQMAVQVMSPIELFLVPSSGLEDAGGAAIEDAGGGSIEGV